MPNSFASRMRYLGLLSAVFLLTANVEAGTIQVFFHGTIHSAPIQRTVNNGSTWTNTTVGLFHFERTGGTETDAPLVGTDLYGFCIEPLESVSAGTTYTYDWAALETAPTNLAGGMGVTKANQLRQLYQRYFPVFNVNLIDDITSRALQIATWEIVRQTGTGPYNVFSGNTRFRVNSSTSAADQAAATAAMNRAQTYLTSLVPTNQYTENPNWYAMRLSGAQDIGIQYFPTPEPMTSALVGIGLAFTILRKRAQLSAELRLPKAFARSPKVPQV